MEQGKIAALLDELEKIAAVDPFTAHAAFTAFSGLATGIKHGPWAGGGKSHPEIESRTLLDAAMTKVEKSEPGTSEHATAKKELVKALKEHKANVGSAEMAGLGLIGGGLHGLGIFSSTRMAKNLLAKEKGRTSDAVGEKLFKHFKPELPVHIIPGATAASAVTVPKGGLLPKFLRGMEQSMLGKKIAPIFVKHMDSKATGEQSAIRLQQIVSNFTGKTYNPGAVVDATKSVKEQLQQAIKATTNDMLTSGYVLAPTAAGPHVMAHELGHEAFSRKALGKFLHGARIPLSFGGPIAAGIMASKDPDSTASKLAPVVGALSTLPVLGEEAYASWKGMQALKKIKASPKILQAGKKQLGKALGAYALLLGVPGVLGPVAIRKLRQYQIARRGAAGLDTSPKIKKQLAALESKGG